MGKDGEKIGEDVQQTKSKATKRENETVVLVRAQAAHASDAAAPADAAASVVDKSEQRVLEGRYNDVLTAALFTFNGENSIRIQEVVAMTTRRRSGQAMKCWLKESMEHKTTRVNQKVESLSDDDAERVGDQRRGLRRA